MFHAVTWTWYHKPRIKRTIFMLFSETNYLVSHQRQKNVRWSYSPTRGGTFSRTNDQHGQKFPCGNCHSVFSRKHNLQYHLKFECGQLPRFNCPYCVYRTKHGSNVRAHVRRIHPGNEVYVVDISKTGQLLWFSSRIPVLLFSGINIFICLYLPSLNDASSLVSKELLLCESTCNGNGFTFDKHLRTKFLLFTMLLPLYFCAWEKLMFAGTPFSLSLFLSLSLSLSLSLLSLVSRFNLSFVYNGFFFK